MKPTESELKPTVVLGVGAHPDDLDFNAGGTLAKWAAGGAKVYYLVLTAGGKGSAEPGVDPAKLGAQREAEQSAAAGAIGVTQVSFGTFEDGTLENTQELRRAIVRAIRQYRPQVVIGFDPTYVYSAELGYINHPDHRAAGQATLDAVYPLARDRLSFPELGADGFEPHEVQTMLLVRPSGTNYDSDITSFMDIKNQALKAHASQPFLVAQEIQATESFVRIDIRPS